MRLFAAATALTLISAAVPAPAAASIITLNETFTVTGLSSGSPLSTLTGSFSLTFDNSADALDTTGTVLTISVDGLSLAGATTMFAYTHAFDTLHVGAYSVGNFVTNAGTNYIDLHISQISTTPMFADAQFSQAGFSQNFFSRTGTVTPVTPVAAVPEPVSLALLSTGLAITGVLRRRFRGGHQG
jgi:hypothetical protein